MSSPVLNSNALGGTLAPGGRVAQDFEALWRDIWRQDHVPPALLELCRLRLAVFVDAPAEFDTACVPGIDPVRIAAVKSGAYATDPSFGPAEQAVLEFAEIYAQDPSAITDELADAVKAHFGEAGLVCLIESLGFIEARIRLGLMFTALAATPAA